MRAILTAITASLFLFTASGCLPDFIYGVERIEPEPEANLQDKRILVVPFREKSRWYGESATGRRMALGLEQVLRRNCSAEFLSADGRKAAVDPIFDCTDPTVPWKEMVRLADVDAIVVGDITERSYGQQQIVGMLTGRISVLIEIWHKDGTFYSNELTETFPKDPEHGEIAPSFEESRTEVESKLIGLVAKEIGDLLCGYEKSID